MRTIKEILAENPDARFSCNDVELGAFSSDEILEQIEYCDEIPEVTYCKPNYFSIDATNVLENESDSWDMAYDDWRLECSQELRAKLQAVLDEIVAENKDANISYTEGETLDISQEWLQMGREV